MAGYFVKKLPEISIIVVYDDNETEVKSQFLTDVKNNIDMEALKYIVLF